MSEELMLDVGQANELKLAFRKAGFTNIDIKRLTESSQLRSIRELLLGNAEITQVTHFIDCDKDPVIPYGDWTIADHQKQGSWTWNPSEVSLYLTDQQKKGTIRGDELCNELTDKKVLNVCVLDYLLEHPQLIPESWKKDEEGNTRFIFFWGTIYRNSDGDLCVGYLFWDGVQWGWLYDWLGLEWSDQSPAAVRVS
jgi:hypothetical protein